MAETESGWTKELPTVNGWYWSRRHGPRQVLRVHGGSVAYGSVWMTPALNPTFFENREWLGPLSPSDAEQLIQLRKAAEAALGALRYMRDADPQHWDFHVTPEICTAWDKLRSVLTPKQHQEK